MEKKINITISKREIITIALLLLISLLLSFLRPLIYADSAIPDSVHYFNMVEAFRGNISLDVVPNAWKLRLLVPALAAIIPLNAYLALNIVSVIFNLLSVLFFYKFLPYFKITSKQQVLGTLIFIFTAPTIVLGFTPLTDSAGIFFIIFSLYLYTISKKDLKQNLILGCVIGLGVVARETVIFVVPVIILWKLIEEEFEWKSINAWKSLIIYTISIGLLSVIIFIILKFFFAPRPIIGPVDMSEVISNFRDFFDERTLATIAQLAFLLLIGIYCHLKDFLKKDKTLWKLVLGMGVFIIPFMLVFLYEDMSFRFFWSFFIFAIPIFLLSIDKLASDSEKREL